MKKGKIIKMPTTVEAQIKTRARSLPIYKCYVNSDWEKAQMAYILVTRKHQNGNISFGFYLVDLLLLGVKDCFYDFNITEKELHERYFDVIDLEFDECEYVLVHNIIFEGISFSEEYGFKPCKEFANTGIYFLEEDDDKYPEMHIPLGEDGIPVVLVTPKNNMQKEIAMLEKTAGPDNYFVYHLDEEGNVLDDDDEYDDDDDDEYFYQQYCEVLDEISETGLEDFFIKRKEDFNPTVSLAIIDILYRTTLDDDYKNELFEQRILISKDSRFDPALKRLPGIDKYTEALQNLVDNMHENDENDEALHEFEAILSQYPDDVDLNILYFNMLLDMKKIEEAEQLLHSIYERHSDYYALRLVYAEWLVTNERFDEALELFGNIPGLDAITTENLPFTKNMVSIFCGCYALIWLSKGEIAKAEPYYHILLQFFAKTSIGNKAIVEMFTKKKDAVFQHLRENINE